MKKEANKEEKMEENRVKAPPVLRNLKVNLKVVLDLNMRLIVPVKKE